MDQLYGTQNVSPPTLIGSPEVEINPLYQADSVNMEKNSYGRPDQRFSPTPRQPQVVRPVMNPQMIPSNGDAFTTIMPASQRIQGTIKHSFPQANYFPMQVPFYNKIGARLETTKLNLV